MRKLVAELSLANVNTIAMFASCGDIEGKYQNDAANLPDYGKVAHLFTELGGGPFVLPEGWDINNLGVFGRGFVENRQAHDRINASNLTERPNQRMADDTLKKFLELSRLKKMGINLLKPGVINDQ